MLIHPAAIVSPSAQLGDNVSVGAFAIVESGTVLSDGCVIRERAQICTGTALGKNCVVHMNAVVGHTPQDFSYKGEPLKTVLGDGVTVRENVTIHGSPKDAGTRVGNSCYLMAGCHVAHDCQLGNNVILANGALLAGHVQIQDSVFISGNVSIHQFVRVGRLAMVAGGSHLGMDVPPYLIADGRNAITVLNAVGLRRSPLLNADDRSQIKAAYKILYRSNLELNDALSRLESDFTSPAVKYWLDFFRAPSKRGLCRLQTGGRRAGDADISE